MTDRHCKLSEIGRVGLGYKSLQNTFFYVDESIIKTYPIEEKFLRPILRIKEINSSRFYQKV